VELTLAVAIVTVADELPAVIEDFDSVFFSLMGRSHRSSLLPSLDHLKL
jgi:hypothetical protein